MSDKLVKNPWWEQVKDDRDWHKLADILLVHGGRKVVPMLPEKLLKELATDGKVFDGQSAELLKDAIPSECHNNSKAFVLFNPDRGYKIYTGYALSDDGLWRQHSWVYHESKKEIVETTIKREKYFGIVDDEALNDVEEYRQNQQVRLPGLP